MNDSTALIIFGFFISLVYLIFNPKHKLKECLILISSIYFFYYITTFAWFLTVFIWILLVYLINLYPNRKRVNIYIVFSVILFCALKFDVFSFEKRNLLAEVAIPTGTSFILFQSISLLLNRSSGFIKNPINITKIVGGFLFFPSIIVGPFYKIQNYINGLSKTAEFKKNIYCGFCLFSFGLFKYTFASCLESNWVLKKMPLTVIDDLQSMTTLLIASVYLYANFSGISDIAVGLGKMIGFELPRNFKFPFISTSMSDFWRKWHITLGEWFKENVYYPTSYLCSKKVSFNISNKISILVTFLCIGLWHQFSFKILVYSILNAILVVFFSFENLSGLKKFLSYISTFITILLVNGLFLSKSLQSYYELLTKIFVIDSNINMQKNIFLCIFTLVVLIYFYIVERYIDRLDINDNAFNLKPFSFIISIFNLFLGLSIGLGGVNAIYKGY
jgi:alginate O-acetyltransferase complex protein AlgI